MMFQVDTASTRAALAAALTVDAAVDGEPVSITGHTVRPDVISAYDAWPEFRWLTPVTACIGEQKWYAVCALPPPDQTSTVTAGDAVMSALASSLMTLGRVERAEPVRIPVADPALTADMPGLRFEVTI